MHIRNWIAVVAVLALAACGNSDEGRRVPIGGDTAAASQGARAEWPEGLAAQVDSANLEYSQGDYEASAARYRGLTEQYPEIGTVWFGLYMAEDALGNAEAAQAALEKAESITPGLGQMHEAARTQQEMESGTLPSGHPSLDSVNPEDAPPLEGGG